MRIRFENIRYLSTTIAHSLRAESIKMIGRDMQHACGGNGFNVLVGTQEQIYKIRHGRRELQKLFTISAALSTAELLTLCLIQRRVTSMGHPSVKPIAPYRFDSEGANPLSQRVSNFLAGRWLTTTNHLTISVHHKCILL